MSETNGFAQEVVPITRRQRTVNIVVTHRYVVDPEAVEQAVRLWDAMLVTALKRKLAGQKTRARRSRKDTA